MSSAEGTLGSHTLVDHPKLDLRAPDPTDPAFGFTPISIRTPNSHPNVREVLQTPVQPCRGMASHLPVNTAGRIGKGGPTGWK